MTNARNIWYWRGASSIMQIAQSGVTKPNDCKFTVTLRETLRGMLQGMLRGMLSTHGRYRC
ncbi:hypothetical protein LJC33_00305 [Eubacteriales bacterium OttesenSCG-928-N13]|nr:hypothetical protein [Eubacteriales bacterium OttesenSCG-928-N13]